MRGTVDPQLENSTVPDSQPATSPSLLPQNQPNKRLRTDSNSISSVEIERSPTPDNLIEIRAQKKALLKAKYIDLAKNIKVKMKKEDATESDIKIENIDIDKEEEDEESEKKEEEEENEEEDEDEEDEEDEDDKDDDDEDDEDDDEDNKILTSDLYFKSAVRRVSDDSDDNDINQSQNDDSESNDS